MKKKGNEIIEKHGCDNLPIINSIISLDHYKNIKLSKYNNNFKSLLF